MIIAYGDDIEKCKLTALGKTEHILELNFRSSTYTFCECIDSWRVIITMNKMTKRETRPKVELAPYCTAASCIPTCVVSLAVTRFYII